VVSEELPTTELIQVFIRDVCERMKAKECDFPSAMLDLSAELLHGSMSELEKLQADKELDAAARKQLRLEVAALKRLLVIACWNLENGPMPTELSAWWATNNPVSSVAAK
jgi:hypothetical protein